MSPSTAGRRERVASALAPADSGVPLDTVKVADASGFKQTDDSKNASLALLGRGGESQTLTMLHGCMVGEWEWE